MIERINIKKHKKIVNLSLDALSNVNYLIGGNSSGKSSILESFFLYFAGDKKLPQFEDSEIIIKKSDENHLCHYVTNNNYILGKYRTLTTDRKFADLGHDTSTNLSTKINEYLNIDLVTATFDGVGRDNDLPQDIKNSLVQIAKIFGIDIKKIEKQTAKPEFGERELQINITDKKGKVFPLNFYAGGYIYLLKLTLILLVKIKENYTANSSLIILLEEPEAQLHPKLQKLLPKLLDTMVNIFDEQNKGRDYTLQFMVSTHSPFLISKTNDFLNQKVFLLKEGRTTNLQGRMVVSSKGFTGNESMNIVARMLGFENTDIGYPENFCIIEENSMLEILNYCKNLGILKDYVFVSSGGWTRAKLYMDDILRLKTLLSCNPFYDDKFIVITDQINSKDKATKSYQNLKNLDKRYIELQKNSLEDYYINLDSGLHSSFKALTNPDGIEKADFANKMNNLIKNSDDFSKLFDNELDILLK